MEILKKLSIKNFLGTKKREVDFTMHTNPIFIVGENAGGKTTIMRAVYMALTGEDAFFNKTKLDGLINDHSDNMEIELELVNKRNIYNITVSKTRKKPLEIMILENGNQIIKSSLLKEAKEKLVELFGNPTAILSTYFIFGDNKSDFVDNTPTERLKIITKVSNAFQKYEKISDNAKQFIKKLELDKNQEIGKLELAERNVEEMEEKVKDFNKAKLEKENKEIEAKKELLSETENIKKQIAEIDSELYLVEGINIDEITKKINDNKTVIKNNKEISVKISEIEKDKVKLVEILNQKEIELTKLSGNLSTLENNKKTNLSYIKKITNLELLAKNKDITIEAINERITKGEKAIETKLEEGRKLKTKIEIKASDVKKLEKSIEEKEKELLDTKTLFEHNKECPLCHNALKQDSLENYRKYIEKDIISIKENIKNEEIEIKKLEDTKKIILEQWNKYKSILDELKIIKEDKIIDIENEKIKLKVKKFDEDIVILKEEIKTKEKDVEKAKEDVKNKNLEINKKKEELKPELSENELNNLEKILEANKNINLLKNNKEKLLKKINKEYILIELSQIKQKIVECTRKLDENKKLITTYGANIIRIAEDKKKKELIKISIEELNRNIQEYEDIFRLFGKDGIQKKQIQLLLGQIEMETNALVKKFFDKIAVKFDYSKKGINLKILRRVDLNNGGFELKEDVLGNFSDAQQEVLKVLLKVSFSKVVQNLNNTPLNILFLNETFNTLSKDKEPLLVEILDFYGRHYHIGFITHNHDLIGNYDRDSVYDLAQN